MQNGANFSLIWQAVAVHHKAEQPLAAVPALPHVQMAHAAGVGLLVVGGDAVLFQQFAGAGGKLVHPRGLQLAIAACHNAVTAPGKEPGHDMAVFIGAHRQLDFVAVTVHRRGGQHVQHRHIQLAQAGKGVAHKLRFGGALCLVADMPQPTAAARPGYRAILLNAVRPGGDELFHAAKGVGFHRLDNAHLGHIAGGSQRHKNGLAVLMGHAAAVVGKRLNLQSYDLVFLERHSCSL